MNLLIVGHLGVNEGKSSRETLLCSSQAERGCLFFFFFAQCDGLALPEVKAVVNNVALLPLKDKNPRARLLHRAQTHLKGWEVGCLQWMTLGTGLS